MALLTRLTAPGSPKALQRFQNCIGFLWPSVQQSKNSTQNDVIDSFTNELVTKKSKKWEIFRANLMKKSKNEDTKTDSASATTTFGLISKGVIKDFDTIRSPEIGLDIRSLSLAQLDNLLLATVEIKNKLDFLYLIKQCISWQQLPSRDVLVECLKYLSTLSKTQQIDQFIEICKLQRNPLLKTHADFSPFKAMSMWRNGSSNAAFEVLRTGFASSCNDEEGRRMIRFAFKTMAEETVAQKSEAVLVGLMQIAIQIYADYRDIFVIACVWKNCFASDWFSDHKSAEQLFNEYEDLRALVSRRSQSLCTSFLRQHNVDAVHRLIEAFLQHNQKVSCSHCLGLLFNYQYHRKDLRACAEIVKSCSELQMPLSEVQNEMFLTLFLDQSEPSRKSPKQPQQQFQYKF